MPKQKAKKKNTYRLSFQLSRSQYEQFLLETKKYKGNPAALLRFLMQRYFEKAGAN